MSERRGEEHASNTHLETTALLAEWLQITKLINTSTSPQNPDRKTLDEEEYQRGTQLHEEHTERRQWEQSSVIDAFPTLRETDASPKQVAWSIGQLNLQASLNTAFGNISRLSEIEEKIMILLARNPERYSRLESVSYDLNAKRFKIIAPTSIGTNNALVNFWAKGVGLRVADPNQDPACVIKTQPNIAILELRETAPIPLIYRDPKQHGIPFYARWYPNISTQSQFAQPDLSELATEHLSDTLETAPIIRNSLPADLGDCRPFVNRIQFTDATIGVWMR